MKPKVVEQVKVILNGVTSEEEISKIEIAVAEARGRIPAEVARGFWVDKRPCWEMCQCPEMIKNECPAPRYQSSPCWEIEGTYCKLDDYGASGSDTSICEICRVYKRWGGNRPIEVKLLGKGINTSIQSIAKLREKSEV